MQPPILAFWPKLIRPGKEQRPLPSPSAWNFFNICKTLAASADRFGGARARGADVESFRPLLAANPDTMANFLAHIDAEFGGIEAYLTSIGIDPALQLKLRGRLLDGASA